MNTTAISQWLSLYKYMVTAREIDRLEESYTHRGETPFQVSGSGHEGTVALAPHLQTVDWLHCHYRDKALMLARGVPISMFFHTLFAKEASCSHGRQVASFMGLPELHILSMTMIVGNSALQAAGVASAIKSSGPGIVLCALGDGATQQGEVLEAIAHAAREELPVLFLIHNNRYAISTMTVEKTFFSYPRGHTPDSFYGLALHRINGRDVIKAHQALGQIVTTMRTTRQPAIVIFDVERLCSHTSSDDQQIYRDPQELRQALVIDDPIKILERQILDNGVHQDVLTQIGIDIRQVVAEEARASYLLSEPSPTVSARKVSPSFGVAIPQEYTGTDSVPRYTMGEALREVLRTRLQKDPAISLLGEDIEEPKGDIFGVTKGLSTQFPNQVKNAPLSESTIVGLSIGQALAGKRPVALIQFSDFLPLAYNQIYTELGSMYWRTGGRWEAPVIIMATCGAYRPGLGPFHAESLESIMAHIPGIDVVMPSNAGDAAGLLNAVFDSGRPTIFFYPKNCLYDRQKTTSPDVSRHIVPIGKANIVHPGKDITVVAWGNMIAICEHVLEVMEREGISIELIDLRSLSPWDEQTVLHSVQKTGKLLVIHEENRTCGFGGEILATVTEQATHPITAKRLTRPDTYLPYHFSNQLAILPSFKSILTTIADMCGYEAVWQSYEQQSHQFLTIKATGLSPSDESINILGWYVQVGSLVTEGELLAEFETDKTVFMFESPANGEITELLVPEGSTVRVGEPLIRVKLSHASEIRPHITDPDERLRLSLQKRTRIATPIVSSSRSLVSPQSRSYIAGLSAIAAAKGGRLVTNQELIQRFPERTAQEIFDLTGIRTRCWVDEHESALSLAIKATQAVFIKEDLTMRAIDLIICSTGTPQFTTPSMACLLLSHFSHQQNQEMQIPAYDINAACSGFLYALQSAYDFLLARPQAAVLVVTTETLSQKLNSADFATAPLFGDAASATVICGAEHPRAIKARFYRPVLSAKGDKGQNLTVPVWNNGQYVSMSGQRVFVEAVRNMKFILESACRESGMKLSDLDLIVPHQANQRIIDAIQRRLDVAPERVYSSIQHTGNTSSSSIPLCLETLLKERNRGERVGLCAFGGGFTFGGAVLELV